MGGQSFSRAFLDSFTAISNVRRGQRSDQRQRSLDVENKRRYENDEDRKDTALGLANTRYIEEAAIAAKATQENTDRWNITNTRAADKATQERDDKVGQQFSAMFISFERKFNSFGAANIGEFIAANPGANSDLNAFLAAPGMDKYFDGQAATQIMPDAATDGSSFIAKLADGTEYRGEYAEIVGQLRATLSKYDSNVGSGIANVRIREQGVDLVAGAAAPVAGGAALPVTPAAAPPVDADPNVANALTGLRDTQAELADGPLSDTTDVNDYRTSTLASRASRGGVMLTGPQDTAKKDLDATVHTSRKAEVADAIAVLSNSQVADGAVSGDSLADAGVVTAYVDGAGKTPETDEEIAIDVAAAEQAVVAPLSDKPPTALAKRRAAVRAYLLQNPKDLVGAKRYLATGKFGKDNTKYVTINNRIVAIREDGTVGVVFNAGSTSAEKAAVKKRRDAMDKVNRGIVAKYSKRNPDGKENANFIFDFYNSLDATVLERYTIDPDNITAKQIRRLLAAYDTGSAIAASANTWFTDMFGEKTEFFTLDIGLFASVAGKDGDEALAFYKEIANGFTQRGEKFDNSDLANAAIAAHLEMLKSPQNTK